MSDRGRAMLFPYTFAAKMVQFPYKFYFTNNWVWKYYAIGVLVSLPVFAKLQAMSYSPENVARVEEARKKEAAEHH